MSAAGGTLPALDRLTSEHMRYTRAVLLRLLSGRGQGDVEDLVQEVLFEAFRAWKKQKGGLRPSSFLAGVAQNVVKSYRRRLWRRAGISSLVDTVDVQDTLPSQTTGPSEQLENAERAAQFWALMGELPTWQRDVYLLVELEGLPVPEAANSLGINRNTAHNRLRLARETIAAKVKAWTARGRV